MTNHYQRRFIHGCEIALLLLAFGGCAVRASFSDRPDMGDVLRLYQPFNNVRDWAPGNLIGPPGHNLGYQTQATDRSSARIDTWAVQADSAAAVPKHPPPALP